MAIKRKDGEVLALVLMGEPSSVALVAASLLDEDDDDLGGGGGEVLEVPGLDLRVGALRCGGAGKPSIGGQRSPTGFICGVCGIATPLPLVAVKVLVDIGGDGPGPVGDKVPPHVPGLAPVWWGTEPDQEGEAGG